MKDIWYADNRDIIKWSVLLRLAEQYKAAQILQVAYYRPSRFATIEIDNHIVEIPLQVIEHFRRITNIKNLRSNIPIHVLDQTFDNRAAYLENAIRFLAGFGTSTSIVFLDPDTGLQPTAPGLEHVLESEAKAIWENMRTGDILVFYQHQTNRNGTPWVEPKRKQLARALGVEDMFLKVAQGKSIARDVVFFYSEKQAPTMHCSRIAHPRRVRKRRV